MGTAPQQAAPAPPPPSSGSHGVGWIDPRVCRAMPPRGLVRLNNPPLAVWAWLPAGLPAIGITALATSMLLGPQCLFPSLWSKPISTFPGQGLPTIPGMGGAFPGQERFPDSCRSSGRCWQSPE